MEEVKYGNRERLKSRIVKLNYILPSILCEYGTQKRKSYAV